MSDKGHKVFWKGESSISWHPKDGPHSQFLSLEDYKVFHKISRTIHLPEYMEAKNQHSLSPGKLTSQSMCRLLSLAKDLQVLWYGVCDPWSESSCYGNVCFISDMVKLMNYCKGSFNIYFVEVVDFKTSNATRILFSRKTYDYLEKYNPTVFGGPWYIDPIGKHYSLQNSRRYDGKTNGFGHKLEFMLETEPADASWLYDESVQRAVDHHEANSGQRHKCVHFGLRNACPSPLKKEETLELISSLKFDQNDVEKMTPVPSRNGNALAGASASLCLSDGLTRAQNDTLQSVRRCLF